VALIVLGVLLLLHTSTWLNFQRIVPYWPVLLIAAGAYMLWSRFAVRNRRREKCAMKGDRNIFRAVRGPVTLITIGGLFALQNSRPTTSARLGPCC